MNKKLGFIGLGTMGLPMAKNLLKAHGQMLVSDVVEAKKEEIKKLGAEVAADNREVARECDILFVSLPTVKIVEMVVSELIAEGRAGQYIIDTSTIGYDMTIALGKAAKERGIHYIDAPISGGAGRSADGSLSVITGASRDEMEKAGIVPLFDAIGRDIHYTGTRGGGTALKIINNMLSKSILFADAEAILLAEHMGIPFETLYGVISTSSSQNEILRIKKEHIANHEYDPSNKSYSPITQSLKDLGLARELSDTLGVANFSCNNVIQWYRMGVQRGYAEKDSSAIVELLRDLEPAPASRD